MTKALPTIATAIALVAVVAWSFHARWEVLSGSPFPIGVDGYFYPIQLRAVLEHGTLQYPASPVAFYLMAPLAALTDPIVGAKLGAALGGALVALPAYAVGKRLGGGRAAGLVAAALAAASAGSAYLTIEFVKNGIGITLALAAVAAALAAIEAVQRKTERTWPRLVVAAGAIALAYGTHKAAAGLVLVIVGPAALADAIGRGALRGRRLIYAIAAAAALAVVGLAAPRRFLSTEDIELLRGLFTTDARLDAPALSLPGVEITLGGEAALAAVVAAIAALVVAASGVPERPVERNRLRRWFGDEVRRSGLRLPAPRPATRVAAWVVIALGLLVGLPWLAVDDPQGLGFRLRILAFVPLALCGAIVAGAALELLRRLLRRWLDAALAARDRETEPDPRTVVRVVATVVRAILRGVARGGELVAGKAARAHAAGELVAGEPVNARGELLDRASGRLATAAVVAIAAILAVRVPGNRREGEILAHPALVSAIIALDHAVPATDTIIVPERHIEFMVAWYTRANVSLRPEPLAHDRRWRLMPLAFIHADSPLDQTLLEARREPGLVPPLGLHARLPNGLVLVHEATWDWVFAHLPEDEQARVGPWPTL